MQRHATIILSSLAVWLLWAVPAHTAQIGAPKFDHLTTGFELLDAHLDVPCESCHVGAVFKGTPRDCASCHSRGARITATFKSPTHVLSTDRCDACHTTVAWQPASRFDHTQVQGSCASCHNGTAAPGLPANHFPISEDCGVCHLSTTAFGPGTKMNHTGIVSNCSSCHETGMNWVGVTMVDRPTAAQDASHPSTGDCANCHASTVSFTLGVNVKPANHIPTSQACTLCHTNPNNFAVYTMNHAGITNNCIQCHGAGLSFANVIPKEPPPTHIPTAGIACEGCHSPTMFTSFAGTTMNHTPVAAMACDACHETGMSWFGVKIQDRPRGHHTGQDCKGCHGTSNWSSANGNAAPPGVSGTARVQNAVPPTVSIMQSARTAHASGGSRCAGCHDGLGATGKGSAHIQSNDHCDNCHTTIAWLPARFEHQGVAQACSSCHNSVVGVGMPASHVHTSLACSSCHSTFAWLPAIFSHAAITGACQACHNGAGASGKSTVHMLTTLDCASCHDTNSWGSVRYRHIGPTYQGPAVATGNCRTCHKNNTDKVAPGLGTARQVNGGRP